MEDLIQEYKSTSEKLHHSTIYRLQRMLMQQNDMINSIFNETAMLENMSKHQNKTFFENKKKVIGHIQVLKERLAELNTSLRVYVHTLRSKIEEQNSILIQQNAFLNELEISFDQKEKEDERKLKQQNSIINGQNISFSNLISRFEQKEREDEQFKTMVRNNQSRLENLVHQQQQEIRNLTEKLEQQKIAFINDNETKWLELKNLSRAQDGLQRGITSYHTLIQSQLNTIVATHARDKNQQTASVNRIQSSLSTLSTKVASGFRYCSCQWTSWVNWYDNEVRYTVPNGKVMAGMLSQHNNHYEDRVFQFYICSIC